MIFPSFCILLLISFFFDRFLDVAWVASAFRGIKIAVGILIVDAAVRMFKKLPKKAAPLSILLCSFAAMLATDVLSLHISTIVFMLAAAAVGMLVCLAGRRKGDGTQK